MGKEEDRVIEQVVKTSRQHQGFLPIKTNAFDRGFIGVMCFVAIHLAWLRFIEPLGLTLWIATGLSLVLMAIIGRYG